jgi:selenocysteine-specific elongation factor
VSPPRSLIVGTAGHIDHGKSALVRALTGTDPDRLKEEKERGITIDLGFAHADLGGGVVASFVDVPGHERFVRNMLAGAHGIDVVVLVVAADESVMPQTREHFHICRLLGIPAGVVALTKCDVADAEMQSLAELEVRELVAGSFLEGAPILRVSAKTGGGLDALKDTLRGLAHASRPRAAEGLLRLPVDRSFSLHGFGTVVTGTLVSGTLAVGEEVEALPSGRRARVRGLQVHGAAVDRVAAGNRTAANVAGVEVADVARGDVLVRPGTLRSTSIVEADVTLLPGERPLKDQARVRVHAASAEVLARLRLPEGGPLAPGRTARAQLRMEAPVVVGRGDRLVLRSYSPAVTVGGAVVLDPLAPKRKRGGAAPEALAIDSDLASAAAGLVAEAGRAGIDAPTLAARLTVPTAEVEAVMASRADVRVFGREPARYVAASVVGALARAAVETVDAFHAAEPLRPTMPREELRGRAFARVPPGVFETVLEDLVRAGELRVAADGVSRARHAVRLSPAEDRARTALLAAAREAGLAGLDAGAVRSAVGADVKVADQVVRLLTTEGALRRVGDAVVDASRLEALETDVRQRWPPGSRLDVGAFKDLTGLSRKFVIPLLEYLDRRRVTRRTGADRYVLG